MEGRARARATTATRDRAWLDGRARRRSSSSRPARRCRTSSRRPSRRPTRAVRRPARDARPRRGRARSTSARRRRRARCSCSSTRSASRSPSCGGCPRPAARAAVNPPERVKIGTVGPAAPGVELKLADDGELLMRARRRDARLPQRSPRRPPRRSTPTAGCTPATSREIDDDGYVKIVDRKKEIIINAAGKNMSPANIESTLKGASPLIGQACVIGDARPYNTALIVLDADFAPAVGGAAGHRGADLADAGRRRARARGGPGGRRRAPTRSSRASSRSRSSRSCDGDWAPGGDELTPTMKLKRKPIAAKYAAEIEAMYEYGRPRGVDRGRVREARMMARLLRADRASTLSVRGAAPAAPLDSRAMASGAQ